MSMTLNEAEDILRENFIAQLKDNMELNKLTAIKLAKMLNTHPNVIHNWKSGKCFPSLTHALALSRNLGITIDFLATGTD